MSQQLPKCLVIGSSGFLGQAFLRALCQQLPDTLGLSRHSENQTTPFDMRSPDLVPYNLKGKDYQYGLILAAKTRVAECEKSPKETRAINVDGTLVLVNQLLDLGITPVFFSSDYVFDGIQGNYDATAPTKPTTEYGLQKVEVEQVLSSQQLKDRSLVIRLSKVFSLTKEDGSLLDDMAQQLKTGKTIRAARDQLFCPTLIDDVLRATFELLSKHARGTYNLCSPEIWSRYDLATALAKALAVNEAQVQAISLDDLNEGFARPYNTSMCSSPFERKFAPIQKCVDQVAKLWQDA